jgi:hypothetical protein
LFFFGGGFGGGVGGGGGFLPFCTNLGCTERSLESCSGLWVGLSKHWHSQLRPWHTLMHWSRPEQNFGSLWCTCSREWKRAQRCWFWQETSSHLFCKQGRRYTVVQCQHIVAGRRYHVDSQCVSFRKTHPQLSSSGYIWDVLLCSCILQIGCHHSWEWHLALMEVMPSSLPGLALQFCSLI